MYSRMLQDSKSYFITATGRVPLPSRHWQQGRRQPWLNLVLSAKSIEKLWFICIYEKEGSRMNCVPLPLSHCSSHLIGKRKIILYLSTHHHCPIVREKKFILFSMNYVMRYCPKYSMHIVCNVMYG